MRVVGFGACMINGFGVGEEFSFFNQAIDMLKSEEVTINFSEVISLGGFPINRAAKYLDKKVIPLNPDVVILQFGNTDINIDLEKKLNKILKRKTNKNNLILANDPKLQPFKNTLKNKTKFFIKYSLKNIASFILNLKATTSVNIYISYLEKIINELKSRNIKVIVLSPFPTADFIRNRRSLKYMRAVKQLNNKFDFTYIDCLSIFKKYHISDFLLTDGTHLSLKGHSIVATEIMKELEKLSI